MAHDFDNILAVVLSNAELALETLSEEHEEARGALTDLKRTAEVGVGTNVRIFLPATTDEVPETAEEASDDAPSEGTSSISRSRGRCGIWRP